MELLIDPSGRTTKRNIFKLISNNWDDYTCKTMFSLTYIDGGGEIYLIGDVKIGYQGQTKGWTKAEIIRDCNFDRHTDLPIENLPKKYFSVGQDVQYYENIMGIKNIEHRRYILGSLKDIAADTEHYSLVCNEDVFHWSLTREVHVNSIVNQFRRVLNNEAMLTKYRFSYKKNDTNIQSGFNMNFSVEPASKPPTNMHVLIGKNGVGKTTLLNDMVKSLLVLPSNDEDIGCFYKNNKPLEGSNTERFSGFSGVVSLAFSVFDRFDISHINQKDNFDNIKYNYIGLRKVEDNKYTVLKTEEERATEFKESLISCISFSAKKDRWLKAIKTLETDKNFKDNKLHENVQEINLGHMQDPEVKEKISQYFINFFLGLSSGHAIVLLSITKLVEYIEEKTLVLIDEPEGHLHPPLLSAFIRAISDLLVNRNAVAIVATHSPVVLQEVPKSCVYKIKRIGAVAGVERPKKETFAENVGTLTREVFGLDVEKSGFHELLKEDVLSGLSYEQVINEYDKQIGFEGKLILQSMVSSFENGENIQ